MNPRDHRPPALAGLAEGRRRRDAALCLLREHRAALVRRLQRRYLRQLLDGGPATVDGLRSAVPIPAGIDPRVCGAAVKALADDRIIRSIGRERSRRPEAHGRWIDRWAVIDRAAAVGWLATHPELIDEQGELFED